MLTFRIHYFLSALLLFLVEVAIAAFVHDAFIRPYVGDFLVVVLLYCFVQSFLKLPVKTLAIAVLLFAYAIEVSQYFHLVNRLGYQNHTVIRTVMGNSFEWSDMLAYTLGILLVVWVEEGRRLGVKTAPQKY